MSNPMPFEGMQLDSDRLADLVNAYAQASFEVGLLKQDIARGAALVDAWAHDAVSVATRDHYHLHSVNGPASTYHALDEWHRELSSIRDNLSRMLAAYRTNESDIAASARRL